MNENIYKKEFVERVAAKGSEYRHKRKLADKDASEMIDNIVLTIREIVAAGDSVTIPGLGTFFVDERKETQNRSIRSNKITIIPAHNVVKFRPTDKLKQAALHGVAR